MSVNTPDGRTNNFSLLRICFATLVILSHSFGLIDGNSSREILTRVFGTLSFGALAVDGFFLISGYLITKSYLNSPTAIDYLLKRVLRIYPGFAVAFVFSYIVALYFSHLAPVARDVIHNFFTLATLNQPGVDHCFPGSNYPAANGAMWTISYEFRCYLLIMLLGAFGLFNKRKLIFAGTCVLTIALYFFPDTYVPFLPIHGAPVQAVQTGTPSGEDKLMGHFLGKAGDDLKFATMFMVGSCFYLMRKHLIYTKTLALIAMIILISAMFSANLCQPALALFGGYLVFWFALNVREFALSAYFNRLDLSYGIYLYAWPVQKILILEFKEITPYELFFAAFVISFLLSYLSWTLIERPALRLKSRGARSVPPALEPNMDGASTAKVN